MSVVEIEVKGDNRNLFFEPLGKTVRGELDFQKVKEPQARLQADRWSGPIPGQRISIDSKAGIGKISDPLHTDAYKPVREQITKNYRLPPAEEEFDNAHVPSWLDRMKRAVDAGHATITKGQFPDKLPGKPIKRFLTMDEPTEQDKQTAVFDRLASAMDKLAERLGGWDAE